MLLRDFIDEIASELDARADKPLALLPLIKMIRWASCASRWSKSSLNAMYVSRMMLSADPAMAAFTGRRHVAITALAAPPNDGSQLLATDDFSFYATRAKLLKKKESSK
jgi:hypothetical protein